MAKKERKPRPLPWKCPACRAPGRPVKEDTFRYVKPDVDVWGTPRTLIIEELTAPRCSKCREILFVNSTHPQITEALCKLRGLLTPEEIREGIASLHVTQVSFAKLSGIAQETLSRWCNHFITQSRAMDKYLRLLFKQGIAGQAMTPPLECPKCRNTDTNLMRHVMDAVVIRKIETAFPNGDLLIEGRYDVGEDDGLCPRFMCLAAPDDASSFCGHEWPVDDREINFS